MTSSIELFVPPTVSGSIAVLAAEGNDHTWELLGDASDVAVRLGKDVWVLAFQATETADSAARRSQHAEELIQHGADVVTLVELEDSGSLAVDRPFCAIETRLAAIERWYRGVQPRVLFIAAAGDGRQLAARLAARCEVELLSPALCARVRGDRLEVTALHQDGRRACQVDLTVDQPAIVVLNKDVGQSRLPDSSRTGIVNRLVVAAQREAVLEARFVGADPAAADIQHLPRLVAGGYGLGGKEGFELLRSVAERLDAGVAASRMAVDLGWVERERQVGQSGRTVRPELYIACGISGASHHLEGMAQSQHIVAINIDPQAPIFRVAHLGLVADWRETLLKLNSALSSATESEHSSVGEAGDR